MILPLEKKNDDAENSIVSCHTTINWNNTNKIETFFSPNMNFRSYSIRQTKKKTGERKNSFLINFCFYFIIFYMRLYEIDCHLWEKKQFIVFFFCSKK